MPKKPDLNIDNYHDVVREFHSESDRSAALLAASFLDNFLEKYLRKITVQEKKLQEDLFDGFGPLSSLGSRIKIAYSFGFIKKQAYTDLETIKKIRNHFAHHPISTSFSDEYIIQLCKSLSMTQVGQDGGLDFSARNSYLLTISMIVMGLHNAMFARKIQKNHHKETL